MLIRLCFLGYVVRSALIIIIMEQIYNWIGLIIFWTSAIIGSVVIIGYLGKILLNELGRRLKIMWIMVEFAHYRKEFKNWVKDKERHPKCKS